MRRPQFIARQASCPTGVVGALLAKITARETAPENTQAIQILSLKPTEYVLEVGFGHGRTMAIAAEAASQGLVAGIDVSERMVRMAQRYNRVLISSGRLELTHGDAEHMPYADSYFDKAYSIHTVYFWPRPMDVFKDMRRVLKNDGLLLLGFRPDQEETRSDFPASVYKFYSKDELRGMVEKAGFEKAEFYECDSPRRHVLFLVARGAARPPGFSV